MTCEISAKKRGSELPRWFVAGPDSPVKTNPVTSNSSTYEAATPRRPGNVGACSV